MLVPMRAILDAADKNGYAQGAFNVNAVCQVKAAVDVHQILRSPAIIQGADLANGFMGGRTDFANSTLEDKKAGAKNIGATGPKIRLPRSSPALLSSTHALSSKRMYEPSARRISFFVRTIKALDTAPFFKSLDGITFLTATTITSPTLA